MKIKGMGSLMLLMPVLLLLILLLLPTELIYAQNQDIAVTFERNRQVVNCAQDFSGPIKQSYIVRTVPGAVATLLMFPGAKGKLFVEDGKLFINQTNFLVRSRHLFASFGFNIAVMDAATDFLSCPDGLVGQRQTPEYISDMHAVIQNLRDTYRLPVWVIGTSAGSIAAAQAATESTTSPWSPSGLVLTSSVTNPVNQPDSVLKVSLESIAVPTLIVTHAQDGCDATPPAGAQAIAHRLVSAPKVNRQTLYGGFTPLSIPCEALSHHGYFGIESIAVVQISYWIRMHIPH